MGPVFRAALPAAFFALVAGGVVAACSPAAETGAEQSCRQDLDCGPGAHCDPVFGICRAGTVAADAADASPGVEIDEGPHCQDACPEAGATDCASDGDAMRVCVVDPSTGCLSWGPAITCDDGNACTRGDACVNGACVSGVPADCDDGLSCTSDACDLETGACTNTPEGACVIDGACVPGGTVDALNGCQICHPEIRSDGWSPRAEGTLCDDGDACTEGDACEAGACVLGQAKSCDDGLECTSDLCDPSTGSCSSLPLTGCVIDGACVSPGTPSPEAGCMHCRLDIDPFGWSPVANGAYCDDGDPCTLGDQCAAGSCAPTSVLRCDDGLDCTSDFCDAASGGCTHTLLQGCLIAGACAEAGSSAPSMPCLVCEPEFASDVWVARPDGKECDDGNACTVADTCSAGLCVPGAPRACDDGLECTADSCDPTTGDCGSTVTEGCVIAGVCVETGARSPAGACLACRPEVSATGYVPVPEGGACDDGDPCTVGDRCASGACTPEAPADCDDGLDCTLDACDPSGGGCSHSVSEGCAIDGSCIAAGAVSPDNPCLYCRPELDAIAWSSLDGRVCGDYPNGEATCVQGACAYLCDGSREDCDGDVVNGCEVDLSKDLLNCGSCSSFCGGGLVCAGGSCTSTCQDPLVECGGTCVNPLSDPENCGGCDLPCSHATVQSWACASGQCIVASCQPGFEDMNGLGADGCERQALGGAVLWVQSLGGGGEADGSVGKPFANLQAAVAVAQPGDTIKLLPGSYPGGVGIDVPGLRIEGAGVSSVVLESPSHGDGLVITADGVRVRHLTVQGGSRGIVFKGTPAASLVGGKVEEVRVADLRSPAGDEAVGVLIRNADGVSVSLTEVIEVRGGQGAKGICEGCVGGAGGHATGIRVLGSTGFVLTGNDLTAIVGGTGGSAEQHSRGGAGGTATGIEIAGSSGGKLLANEVGGVLGGKGGSLNEGSGGVGGIAAGIHLSASKGNGLEDNHFSSIHGGEGGAGGNFGAFGAPQQGYGIYLEPDALENTVALNNTLDDEPIIYLNGVSDVEISGMVLTATANPTNLGKIVVMGSQNVRIVGNRVGNFIGRSGCTASVGTPADSAACAGWPAAGIRLEGCAGCLVEANEVTDIRGGQGGTGIWGQNAGGGGAARAIFVSASPLPRIRGNRIHRVQGGIRGSAGPAGGMPGVRGAVIGVDLESAIGAELEHNLIWDLREAGDASEEPAAACVRLGQGGSAKISGMTCVIDPSMLLGGSAAGLVVRDPPESVVEVLDSVLSGGTEACLWAAESVPAGMVLARHDLLFACGEEQAENVGLGDGMIAADPDFVSASSGDFHLKPSSPAIDAARPEADYCAEPESNGCAGNLGVFGGTAEATSSPGSEHCGCQ